MEINRIKAERILNPTSIDLGEYVINPYKGCAYSCLYCYVRSNKSVIREKRSWGSYVDAKINTPILLEKEITKKKPRKVLLGSTTECFAPYEREFGLTKSVIEILNERKIRYSILTRSPLVTDHIKILKEGYCESIYFTVNNFDGTLKKILEPKSPGFNERKDAVNILLKEGIHVIPYFSPILPGISKIDEMFFLFPEAKGIDLEGLNFNLGNIQDVISGVSGVYPEIGTLYRKMLEIGSVYEKEWEIVRKRVMRSAIKSKKIHHLFIHKFRSYFENRYM